MGELAPPSGPFAKEGTFRRVGDILLESAAFTPPISRSSRLAFGICRVSDRLSLSLRADSRHFSTEAEQALLALYAQAWRTWQASKKGGISDSERTESGDG